MLNNLQEYLTHYFEFRSKCPNAILVFKEKNGLNFILFDDAIRSSDILRLEIQPILLTENLQLPGLVISDNSLKRCINKLVDYGLKVALCERDEGVKHKTRHIDKQKIVDLLQWRIQREAL